MELVSLPCNRDFTSASSYGLGWYKCAIATQWYQFHTTDARWFSLSTMKWYGFLLLACRTYIHFSVVEYGICRRNIYQRREQNKGHNWSLQWRHNERNGKFNHRCPGCLFNYSFRRRSKKTSKLRVIGRPLWGEIIYYNKIRVSINANYEIISE